MPQIGLDGVANLSQYKRGGQLAFIDGSYTKGTQARTQRELIREWLWEPKGSSLEYI